MFAKQKLRVIPLLACLAWLTAGQIEETTAAVVFDDPRFDPHTANTAWTSPLVFNYWFKVGRLQIESHSQIAESGLLGRGWCLSPLEYRLVRMPEGAFEFRTCASFTVFGPEGAWSSSLASLVDRICANLGAKPATVSTTQMSDACEQRRQGQHANAKIWTHILGDKRTALAQVAGIKEAKLVFPMYPAGLRNPYVALERLADGDYQVRSLDDIYQFRPDGTLRLIRSANGKQSVRIQAKGDSILVEYFRGGAGDSSFSVLLKLEAQGRLVAAVPQSGAPARLGYDSEGRLASLVDVQRDWQFTYDAGLLSSVNGYDLRAGDPDRGVPLETYTSSERRHERRSDGRGFRQLQINRSGKVDHCKEWVQMPITQPLVVNGGTKPCGSATFEYEYIIEHEIDPQGVLPRVIKRTVRSGNWSESEKYDSLGRLAESRNSRNNKGNEEIWKYTYDELSRPVRRSIQSLATSGAAPSSMEISWDACGKVGKAVEEGKLVFQAERTSPPECRVTRLEYEEGVLGRTYSNKGRSVEFTLQQDAEKWVARINLDGDQETWREGRLERNGMVVASFTTAGRDLTGLTGKRRMTGVKEADLRQINSVLDTISAIWSSPDDIPRRSFVPSQLLPIVDKAWLSKDLQ